MEHVHVFDVRELYGTDDTVYEVLSDFYEATNDSYHRYYPSEDWNYLDKAIKEIINNRCLVLGISETSLTDKKFYILIHFSW